MSAVNASVATGKKIDAGSSAGGKPETRSVRVHRTPNDRAEVPFGRLLYAELRKQVDTRAGRALLITIGVLTALIMIPMVLIGEAGEKSFMLFVDGAVQPQVFLLPVVGILAATSEWSQRTGMVTFTQEPRRIRVVAAKFLSALGLGVAAFVFMLIPVAAANFAAIWFRGAPNTWDVNWTGLAGIGLLALLGMAMGLGFGLLFLSTPAAIVAYFVLPMVWSLVVQVVPWFAEAAPWLDMGTASLPLLMYEPMDGQAWARLAVVTAIWVVLPIVLGTWRVLRREVK